LARDSRNTYGENPKASREGIHRGKQRSHMEERRAVRVLRRLKAASDEDEAKFQFAVSNNEIARCGPYEFEKSIGDR
jgi:hypothetical protein